MSVFILKLIACLTMLIDHTAHALLGKSLLSWKVYKSMRSVGRIAFPIYSFLLVNGFEHSRDRTKYISRLILFAAVSQLPFSLTLCNHVLSRPVSLSSLSLSYYWPPLLCLAMTALACVVWYLFARRDHSCVYLALALLIGNIRLDCERLCILSKDLNVFYTLALGMVLICCLDALKEMKKPDWRRILPVAAAFAVVCWFCLMRCDYDWRGVVLILALYLLRSDRRLQALVMAVWCIGMYCKTLPYLCCALLAAVFILLYNGKLGRRVKIVFYVFYPLHLLVLALLCTYVI